MYQQPALLQPLFCLSSLLQTHRCLLLLLSRLAGQGLTRTVLLWGHRAHLHQGWFGPVDFLHKQNEHWFFTCKNCGNRHIHRLCKSVMLGLRSCILTFLNVVFISV